MSNYRILFAKKSPPNLFSTSPGFAVEIVEKLLCNFSTISTANPKDPFFERVVKERL